MYVFYLYITLMCVLNAYAPPTLLNEINFTDLYGYIITISIKRLRITRNEI